MGDEAAGNLLNEFLRFIFVLLQVFYYIVVNSIKAFFPVGFLPRKSVKNEIVLVTGSGSGLGRLMAIEFGKLGAIIVLWDINEAGNAETKKILESNNVQCHTYTIDLSQKDKIYKVADLVRQEVGDVNILINNAGIVSGKKIFDCPDELMEKTMAVNTHTLFWTAKSFVPKMIERNHGHVVTIASLAGHSGVNGLVDYCASKHAAVGFSDALSAELRASNKNVHVTTINPFYINTGMFDGVKSYSNILFPMLEPDFVIKQIMEAVLTNRDSVFIPKAGYIHLFLKGFLPRESHLLIGEYLCLHKTMNEFVGRYGNNNN